MNLSTLNPLTIPIRTQAKEFAQKFAIEQANPQKGKKVYLNTLAVYAVYEYLKILGIEIDINQGDSWDIYKQLTGDFADLVIPKVGKLECRFVLPGEEFFSLPYEATEDRIGCVAVQFDENLDSVKLLGFVPNLEAYKDSEEVLLAAVQPLDTLFNLIYTDLLSDIEPPIEDNSKNNVINLNDWLLPEKEIEPSWQQPEKLIKLSKQTTQYMAASNFNLELSTQKAKLIELGSKEEQVALIIGLASGEDELEDEIEMSVDLASMGDKKYLPPNLKLTLLNQNGEQFRQIQPSKKREKTIGTLITISKGFNFDIQISLNNCIFTESVIS